MPMHPLTETREGPPTRAKRQKTMHHPSQNEGDANADDPFLTLIPESVLKTTVKSETGEDSSWKYLPLPSKLAYPFWYDPHPIAKWAAEELKGTLNPYNPADGDDATATTTPAITLGKMYGVLVVSLGEEDQQNATVPSQTLGYLRAYSGTMPRPQYGGSPSMHHSPTHSDNTPFVPLVFDRFTQAADGFDYERDEEKLNSLTREIERLESCPERKRQEQEWKDAETRLQTVLSEAKKLQNQKKKERKARRKAMRETVLAEHKDCHLKGFKNEKEAHNCLLEYSDEYRKLEDELVQESAYQQRQYRIVKNKKETDLDRVRKSLNKHRSEIETLKQQRKDGSNELQRKLFDHYRLLNVSKETQSPVEIFKDTPLKVPPSGTGDCAAIKLFQHAFSKGYRPVALAEFWWGPSPHASEGDVARTHGNYYPCCRGKCEPILTRHMLLGTEVESDPLTEGLPQQKQDGEIKPRERELSIIYEDEWLVVVDKPHDVLSVPGRNVQDSIKKDLQKRYPKATGPLLVHRLDYSTSGVLLAAKDPNTHKALQAQFINRTVKKRYEALLEGNLNQHADKILTLEKGGMIDLPLAGDYLNRPMQKVERGPEGKPAVTLFEIVPYEGSRGSAAATKAAATANRTRVLFYPQTGRTHQLRVHASHPEGLGMAIVGDDIYGQRDKRLCLHASVLEIDHPHTQERMTFKAPTPF